jgi:hypothetical protein
MHSVTVRFEPSDSSQTELQQELVGILHPLETEGIITDVNVEAVFPGDETGKYKGTFVVSFEGTLVRAVGALNRTPGIRSAHTAPARAAV